MLEVENRIEGRTVPSWRFHLAQYLGMAMFFLGAFGEEFDWNVWVSLAILLGFVIVLAVLLLPYVKNNIR
jgi:uncharacterized protein (DUF983 family)